MQKQDKDAMLGVSIQVAFEMVKTGDWNKAEFIEWAEAHLDQSYSKGWDAGRDDYCDDRTE